MSEGYTVQHMPHGIAIFGDVPLGDVDMLAKLGKKNGYTLMDLSVASALKATIVLTNKKSGESWRKEIETAANGDWLKGCDTGTSSITIYAVLADKLYLVATGNRRPGIPYDPDDFGRCHRLLQKYPEWVARLPEVAAQYADWTPLVREWARMTALYERDLPTGKCAELYELMKSLEKESRTLRPSSTPPAT